MARIEEIAVALTNQLSVVETPGELILFKKYSKSFRRWTITKHPDYLKFVDVPNDKLGRKSLIAIMKGEKRKAIKQ